MWIFGFSPGVCPTKPSNLVFSLECLVSNRRRALLRGIRLGGSATPSLTWSAMSAGQAQGERKTRLLRRSFSTFGFFLFLPFVTPAPPWSIKGRAGQPTKGTDRFHTQHITHTAKQQPSSWHPFDHSIRDLGHVPLLTICNP